MNIPPSIRLKGYRLYNGSAYHVTASISLMGGTEIVQRQVKDAVELLSRMRLVESHWSIDERHVPTLIDTYFTTLQRPTVEEIEHMPLFGLSIKVLRGPEHRDPFKGPGHPGQLRQKRLRG